MTGAAFLLGNRAGGQSNPAMPNLWYALNTGAGPAAFNMALDEALLEFAPHHGRPVLRFYAWTEPAASFGYFQKHAEIARLTPLRPLVRRPTGGGLVPHAADFTYSLAFPPDHPWYALSAVESYQRVHEWVRDAFAALQVSTTLAPCCRPDAPGQCFAGAEKFDLLWQNQKIAGAAQRRTRQGLLIQGSVQPLPAAITSNQLVEALQRTGALRESCCFEDLAFDGELRERTEFLAREKYSRATHNERR